MNMYRSAPGTGSVSVPQEAVDVMVEHFGPLDDGSSNECITSENGEIGPFDNISYGQPYGPNYPTDLLHLWQTVKFESDLDVDIGIMQTMREQRDKMIELGFSATANTDSENAKEYGLWYDKQVTADVLNAELEILKNEFV